jgi:hypothetical protein
MPIVKPLNHKAQVKQATQADFQYQLFNEAVMDTVNEVAAMYTAVVGSPAQVTSGAAQYSSITAAMAAVASGSSILVLAGNYTENLTITKTLRIVGQGFNSIVNGTIEFSTGASFCSVELMQFLNNITFDSSSNGNFMIQCWLATGFTLTDNGTANYKLVIGE